VVAERRPVYWEWRAELEVQRARWQRIALGLALGALGLVGLLVHQSLRPRPIYYVTTTRGIAEPGHVPEAVVEGFAARVVGLLGNLTPATATAGYEQSRRYLAPKLVDLLHARAQEDLKRITDQQLATTFAIHQAAVEPDGEAWRVSVRGTRQSWSRSQFLGEDRMRYTLEVTRTPVSELNPWGLHVSGLRLERDLPDHEPRAAARGAE
jgi:TraE protein